MRRPVHIVITDSGLGGLAVCAALEQRLRYAAAAHGARLTYVNAWPFEDRGYNDLPNVAARARVFDAALRRMQAMRPDRLLIACNTLSILYPQTAFSHDPPVLVEGIVEAGVDLFTERLRDDPAASIVLIGTKTTIESGVHCDRLVGRGIGPGRVAAVSCHGLAAAIERDIDGLRTAELIDLCASRAAEAVPPGAGLFVGLCCTHYGYVAGRIVDALARKTGRPVRALDPNLRLVESLVAGLGLSARAAAGNLSGEPGMTGAGLHDPVGDISVELISKVALDETARRSIARLLKPVSAATAGALLSYARVPDLF